MKHTQLSHVTLKNTYCNISNQLLQQYEMSYRNIIEATEQMIEHPQKIQL
jgi:hypothetical protein